MRIVPKHRNPPPQTEGATATHFAPNVAAGPADFLPGDFILTHGDSWISRFIRFGQSLVFLGRNRKYVWWSHAALIVSADGGLIEALGNGVQRSKLSSYAQTDFHIVRLNSLASDHDRDQICRFAEWALKQEYGLLTAVSIILSALTGWRFTFGFDGQSICSGLVARALERSSAIFDRSPSHILPADLARYFSVVRPPKGSSKGKIPPRIPRKTPENHPPA